MTDEALLEDLSTILRDLLGDESVALRMETRREDVPGWDSFNYVNFIALVEMQFGIKFRVSEMESFENVGGIVANIQSKLAAK